MIEEVIVSSVETVDTIVIPTPLKAALYFGTERRVGWGYNKTWDAMTFTYDPDTEPWDKRGLTCEWWCRRRDCEVFPELEFNDKGNYTIVGEALSNCTIPVMDEQSFSADDEDVEPQSPYGCFYNDGINEPGKHFH